MFQPHCGVFHILLRFLCSYVKFVFGTKYLGVSLGLRSTIYNHYGPELLKSLITNTTLHVQTKKLHVLLVGVLWVITKITAQIITGAKVVQIAVLK